MSSRKVKKYRGPSRPIDPRYAPGQPKRKGPDTMGFALIGGSAAFVLLLILFIAVSQPPNNNVTTTTDSGTTSGSTNPTSVSVDSGAAATQTTIAFNAETANQPRISPAEAKTQIAANKVKVFDVRDPKIYAQEHIVGAVNVPYTDAQTRLAEFPKTGDILLYCQWPNDEESVSVALLLSRSGYTNYKVLTGGIDAYKQAGGATGK